MKLYQKVLTEQAVSEVLTPYIIQKAVPQDANTVPTTSSNLIAGHVRKVSYMKGGKGIAWRYKQQSHGCGKTSDQVSTNGI